MSRRTPKLAACLLAFTTFCFAQAPSATECGFPQFPQLTRQQNIFTEEQEQFLGDAMAEGLEAEYRAMDDETAAYMQSVGDRISQGLPPTKLRFHFVLVDFPALDAFGTSGGRIYVSRKLVAFTRSEDELAGLLAHEIGHQITHQTGIEVTRQLRELLGVTSLGDRKDVFEKWNRIIENFRRKPHVVERSDKLEQEQQLIADRVALFLMARAGYRVAAFPEFFDRLAGTKGKTGGFFSDMFGTTSADSKRLRELLKHQDSTLPATCVGAAQKHDTEFAAWRQKVIETNLVAHQERVPGLSEKIQLKPPLRTDLNTLRFSPDGRYVAAQDDAGIFVLTREPFDNYLRIEAPDSLPARFSPDSKTLSFVTRDLRVETWDLGDKKRLAATEITLRDGCMQAELSPDGKLLACVNTKFDFRVLDVATQQVLFERKHFYTLSPSEALAILMTAILDPENLPDLTTVAFSPDGRYVAVGRVGTGLAWDTQARSEVKLSSRIKDVMGVGFTFLGNDRVAGVNAREPKKSKVLKFPAGDVLAEPALALESIRAATKGDILLQKHVNQFAIAAFDITQKLYVLGVKTPALDFYGDVFLSERVNGEVGLYDKSSKLLGRVVLPNSKLVGLRARAFSPDLSYVAVSQRSRGAVWRVTDGERVQFVRGFRGGFFAGDGFVADFPKFEKTDRQEVALGIRDGSSRSLYKQEADHATQAADLMVTVEPLTKDGDSDEHAKLVARDAATNTIIWSRVFNKEVPRYFHAPGSSHMGLLFGDWETMKQEVAADQAAAHRLAATKDKKMAYVVEMVDAGTGTTVSTLVVDTGNLSFKVQSANSCGHKILVTVSDNRVLVYDPTSGEIRDRYTGTVRAVDDAGGRVLIENEEGAATLYNVEKGGEGTPFRFSSGVAAAQFNATGKFLGVLTLDQTAYRVDLEKAAAAPVSQQAKQ